MLGAIQCRVGGTDQVIQRPVGVQFSDAHRYTHRNPDQGIVAVGRATADSGTQPISYDYGRLIADMGG